MIPVGRDRRTQELVRVVRTGRNEYTTEELADVRFVPLLGAEGWTVPSRPRPLPKETPLAAAVADCCEPFSSIESADLEPLLERIGDARVVLLGEAIRKFLPPAPRARDMPIGNTALITDAWSTP